MRLLLFLLTSFAFALDPLLQGPGISKSHPGDSGIERHLAVLLAENCEDGSILFKHVSYNASK